MYNRTKRGLNLAAAIIGMVMGLLEIVAGIIGLVIASRIISAGTAGGAATLICSIVDLGLGAAVLVVSTVLCKRVSLLTEEYKTRIGLDVALLVFACIYFVLGTLILCFSKAANVIVIINLLLALVIVPFKITCLFIKDEVEDKTARPKNLGIDQKIAELKHLRELYVITEEQYATAIENIIKEVAK